MRDALIELSAIGEISHTRAFKGRRDSEALVGIELRERAARSLTKIS